MKLRRIFAAFLTVVLLFSASVSVFAYPAYFSEDFSDMELAQSRFILENFMFAEDGGIVGGADAKALQTKFGIDYFWSNYTFVTYDATITLTAMDDEQSSADRFVNLVYANDNPVYEGIRDSRIMMSFTYDFQNKCFRFTEGWNQTDDEMQLLPPVYMDIKDDGSEYYTLGMTVERYRIRCFYNDTLIFDFVDTEDKYLIAYEIESPFLFWNEGNFVHITNISVDRPGYLLKSSYNAGDVNNDGRLTLSDVSLMMKHIAKWKDLGININAADYDRDGKVTLSDATKILRGIARG